MFKYKYPRPAITVDTVIFGVDLGFRDLKQQDALRVLLIKRKNAPFKDKLAIPGGFVNMNETLDAAARRELKEETGIAPSHLEQLYTFGATKRDPRERVVSVAYFGLVRSSYFPPEGNLPPLYLTPKAGDDAKEALWVPVDDMKETLAFDHDQILELALSRLRSKVRYAPIGFDLLPEEFSIVQLHQLYEIILGRAVDKPNFYKRITSYNLLNPVGTVTKKRGRPATLYRFDQERYDDLTVNGINFEV